MRVDTALRIWIGKLPGMVSGRNADACYAEIAAEIGGDFSNREVMEALDRAGYRVQERTERDKNGETVVAVILLPEQSVMS